MTRDFHTQRRDDMRPSSRNQPPARRGDGYAPRSGRPRLNRETVDRAWESGAQRSDPDYHPRSNNGQPPRNQWQQHSPNGRKPYGNSRGNYEQYERNPNPTYRPKQNNHSRSFDTERRTYDEQRGQERREYGNRYERDGQRRPEGRPERRDQSQPYGSRPPYGSRGNTNPNYRETPRRGDAEEGRYGRPPRRFNDNEASQSRYGRDNERSQNRFQRDQRTPQSHRYGRDERPQNGSWQRNSRPQQDNWHQEADFSRRPDRPGTGRDNPFMGRPRSYDRDLRQAQFEGDYERFDGYDEVSRSAQPKTFRKPHGERPEDREFQEEVEHETNSLIAHVHLMPSSVGEQAIKKASRSSRPEKPREAKSAQKSRTRAASAVSRERKQARNGKTGVKVRSKGPKPSQRGFKWPTP